MLLLTFCRFSDQRCMWMSVMMAHAMTWWRREKSETTDLRFLISKLLSESTVQICTKADIVDSYPQWPISYRSLWYLRLPQNLCTLAHHQEQHAWSKGQNSKSSLGISLISFLSFLFFSCSEELGQWKSLTREDLEGNPSEEKDFECKFSESMIIIRLNRNEDSDDPWVSATRALQGA